MEASREGNSSRWPLVPTRYDCAQMIYALTLIIVAAGGLPVCDPVRTGVDAIAAVLLS